jgi:predicted Ser/Thr protein kinase
MIIEYPRDKITVEYLQEIQKKYNLNVIQILSKGNESKILLSEFDSMRAHLEAKKKGKIKSLLGY